MESKISAQAKQILTITSYFQTCEFFLIQDYPDPEASKILNDIANFLPLLHPKLFLSLTSYFQTSLNISTRRHSQCSLVITTLQNGIENLDLFNKLIVPDFLAPTKPEKDHFIFISRKIHSNLILQSKVTLKLKYKILLSSDNYSEKVSKAETFCFFCATVEKSHIETINLKDVKSAHKLFPDWTKNGYGHALRVSSPTKYPFVIELEEISKNKWICKRGQYRYVLEALLPHFNFTYKIFPSTGHDSGKPIGNGSTWTGVVGDILKGDADLGTSTSYNFVRYPLLGFTRGSRYIWVTFTLGQPTSYYTWEAMFWPFSLELWISTFFSLATVTLIFRLLERFDSVSVGKYEQNHLSTLRISFTLVGKDIPSYPKANPARVLLCFWQFSCVVLSTAYVSKIVGLLAFPVLEAQPSNFKELVDPNFRYGWGMDLSGGNLYAHFESSTNLVLRKVFRGLEPPKTAVDCYGEAMRRKFACISWRGTADYVAFKNLTLIKGKSPLISVDRDKTLFLPLGFAMRRNSILMPNFNKVIQLLVDSGQGSKWIEEDLAGVLKESVNWRKDGNLHQGRSREENSELLTLNHLMGVFFMFIFGNGFAILCFSVEFLNTVIKCVSKTKE
ncbi:unnamed protein product [Orchesella dallaii]|uniref:Ionotropic glutamate receptor C-terminal domain-containing protein n=1 Tax=Orchesella dallaii TaxID=48710 RepID=A0ABP1QK07_9HEXA